MIRFDGPRLQKTSLLGLLAILLVTLAPVVSQICAAPAVNPTPGGIVGSAASVCAAQRTPPAAEHRDGGADHRALHLDACVYCGLMFHLPALPGASRSLALGRQSPAPLIIAVDHGRLPAQRFPAGKPRGPPAFDFTPLSACVVRV